MLWRFGLNKRLSFNDLRLEVSVVPQGLIFRAIWMTHREWPACGAHRQPWSPPPDTLCKDLKGCRFRAQVVSRHPALGRALSGVLSPLRCRALFSPPRASNVPGGGGNLVVRGAGKDLFAYVSVSAASP